MFRSSIWRAASILLICGLLQAVAQGQTSAVMVAQNPARTAVWLSDSIESAPARQCSATSSSFVSHTEYCDPCDSGGGLFGGGLLGGREVAGETPWSLWVWASPTYASTSIQSQFGFAEGLNLGYRMTDSVGLYGSVGFNHDSRSTQILGTIGIQKFGNPYGEGLLERSTVWVLWDQGTETEFNSYLHQFRFMMGYSLGEFSEVGMSFTVPTSREGGILSPLGGPGYLTSASSFVGPYVKQRFGSTDLTGILGHSQQGGGGFALGLAAERPITDQVNGYADLKVGEGGFSAASLGVAIPFGRADTKWH